MKHHIYFLLALISMSICACKKDSTGTTTPTSKTKKDFLTQKEWVLVAERLSTDNGAYVDTYGAYSACFKDNRLSFASNGTYINSEGATKCSASAPQTIQQGTWAFTSNETRLSISPSTDVSILQLDDNTLKFLQESVSSGHNYKSEGTWAHP